MTQMTSGRHSRGSHARLAALATALGLLSVLAFADGGGGHGGGGHSSGHSGGHGGQSHGAGHSSAGHSVATHGAVHGSDRGVAMAGGRHGGDHAATSGVHHDLGLADRAFQHDRAFAGLDHHRPNHRHHLHLFGGGFSSFGYRSFYAPSYYRYRDYCDPYSNYYDPRYCYRYGPASDPRAYRSAPPLTMATDFPASAAEDGSLRTSSDDDEVGAERIPDGVGARVPFISSPDPPDVVL